MKTFRTLFCVIISFAMVQCTNLNAEKVKKDFDTWIANLVSPHSNSLELVTGGYVVRGNIKNKPNIAIRLFEMTPGKLVFIDSTFTDKKGDFVVKGSTKDMIFCALSIVDKQMVYLALDNSTQADINVDVTASGLTYSLTGKNIEESLGLKELLKLNETFVSSIKILETEAASIDPNSEPGYSRMGKLQEQYYAIIANRNETIVNFAKGRGPSFLPFFILQYNLIQEPTIELLTLARDASVKANPNSRYTKIIETRYAEEAMLMIGAEAPEIDLPQPNGEDLSLKSLRGKYVLLDFWASWCGPCRKENPNNVKMYKHFKDKSFEIYGISLDQDPNRWKAAIEKDSLIWKHVSDLQGWGSSAGKTYGIHSIPSTVLLDPMGKIIAKGLRGEELAAKLDEILGSIEIDNTPKQQFK